MNCQHCLDFLYDYLAGELSDAERATFECHLAECPPCVDYLAMYRATILLGKAACCEEAAVPERLLRAILAARPSAEHRP